MTQGIGPTDPTDSTHTPDPGQSGPSSPPAAPGTAVRTKVLVGIVAVIVLAALVGLSSKSKSRDSRRMTPAAGSGMVAVPSVVGVAQDRALAALAQQQLTGSLVGSEETCSKPAGAVVKQEPAGMTQAPVGSSVRLVIAERTPISLPEASAGTAILHPGAGHATEGHASQATRVEFRLAGDPCAVGTVVVSHPTAGPEIFELRAGERGSRTQVYGPGTVSLQFTSLDAGARLVVRGD